MGKNHAEQNAASWLESIRDMVTRLDAAIGSDTDKEQDKIRDEILESPLSVEVRSGWYTPGSVGAPEEYCILLTTGGPALRIIGDLSDFNEPVTAKLQWQDWGTPWTDYDSNSEAALLSFANQFYFSEA